MARRTKPKTKRRGTKPALGSQRALADAVGVSLAAVQGWLRDRRWPFRRSAPWPASDVPRIQAWRRRELQPDRSRPHVTLEGELHGPIDPEVRQRLDRVRAEKAEFDLAMARGELHRVDECDAETIRAIHRCKHDLLAMPAWLSVELVNLPADQIRARLRKEIQELLVRFAGERHRAHALVEGATS